MISDRIFERKQLDIPNMGQPRQWGIYARRPGEQNSKIHFHDFDEWYFVLEGRGRVRVGESEHDVEPMQLVYIPAGVLHGTVEVYKDYRLLYIEGTFKGAGREGHLHPEVDAPFDPDA